MVLFLFFVNVNLFYLYNGVNISYIGWQLDGLIVFGLELTRGGVPAGVFGFV
jgi:hypothetical protein